MSAIIATPRLKCSTLTRLLRWQAALLVAALPLRAQQLQFIPGVGVASFGAAVENSTDNELGILGNLWQQSSCGAQTTFSVGSPNPLVDLASASINKTCTFGGVAMPTGAPPYEFGTVTVSGGASMVRGGPVESEITVSGHVLANRIIDAATFTRMADNVTITGPVVPANVVFHIAVHGVATGYPGGTNWTAMFKPARIGFAVAIPAADGSVASAIGPGDYEDIGDGSTTILSYSVPWATTEYFGQIGYALSLTTFASIRTTGDADVFLESDYSHTSQLESLTVLDAGGNDITALEHIQLSTASVATPEPTTVLLMATGLVAAALVRARRREHRRGAPAKSQEATRRVGTRGWFPFMQPPY